MDSASLVVNIKIGQRFKEHERRALNKSDAASISCLNALIAAEMTNSLFVKNTDGHRQDA